MCLECEYNEGAVSGEWELLELYSSLPAQPVWTNEEKCPAVIFILIWSGLTLRSDLPH